MSRSVLRFSPPPADLVETTSDGLNVVTLFAGHDPHTPRVQDLCSLDVYESQLTYTAAVSRALLEQDIPADELRAIRDELAVPGGQLAAVVETRRLRLSSYARHWPAEVAGDVVAYHREWSARGHSTSLVHRYPEAGR
jgi:hypothetical protein